MKREMKREKREGDVENEKCKSLTVVILGGLLFLELKSLVRIFPVDYLLLTKWFLNELAIYICFRYERDGTI